jgi:small subunit ribosomal protein S1
LAYFFSTSGGNLAKKKHYDDLFSEDAVAKPLNEFDQLLNSSTVHTRGLTPGDRFRGEVLAVTGQEAFISTGTPTDAVMPFLKEEGKEPPKAGDVVDVIVVRAREGEILVKAVGSRGITAEADSLEDAFDMELPVEGVVLEEVKGGFRVKVQGVKAFCPISQIDYRCVDTKSYIGKKYEFIITKYERGRDLVVSRRKILDQQKAVGEGDFLRDAEPGSIFEATVFRLEKYGAFVRLQNGVEGLIPIQELAWGRINRPEEAVQMDQKVQVKLLSAVEDGNRLKVSFSLKQGGTVDDPWSSIEQTYPVGTMVDGTVEHKEAFGIFVRIAMGITGLLPRSAWRDATDGKDYENKRKGDSVKVRVDRIDLDNRKLSFSLPREEEDETWRDHQAAKTPSSGAKTAGFGTLGDLLKGAKGK